MKDFQRKVVLEPNTQCTIFPLPPTPSKPSKPDFGPPSTVQIRIREGLGREELRIWPEALRWEISNMFNILLSFFLL